MRFAVDTGGTFTDLMIEEATGLLRMYKAPTTPADPVVGVLDVLGVAAADMDIPCKELLGRGELLFHGTTRAMNAVLTGNTAKTALLVTEGHPDILLFREGGRTDPFNWTRPYPEPFIPRALTFEVPERVGAEGAVVRPLDEAAAIAVAGELAKREVEAVAVCFLWAMLNPAHESRVGELLCEYLPGVPFTLSHVLNPAPREYRRASSTAIDASLKPVMTSYLRSLDDRLQEAGFRGRVLVVTSNGGVLDSDDVADAPIHSLGSGPAMAPVAGRYYARLDADSDTAVVADTGGTSYDVSLVRRGRIPRTRETWLGAAYFGHMTGFPSIDVKSIGAGGGSIAWVDEGGLLHVGPQSAGADPGPACYQRGGTSPTMTDASLVLGYIDPEYFLGGEMRLNPEAAIAAIRRDVAEPLELDVHEAALAILRLTTEHMARAIEEITINQGIDPRTAVLVGGGGAAGLNSVDIARRLGCQRLLIPEVGATLSAAGALLSELSSSFGATLLTTTDDFDADRVNAVLRGLAERCEAFIAGPGSGAIESTIEFEAEARYPYQNWELELPLRVHQFNSADEIEQLRQDFHALHEEVFAIKDPGSAVEVVAWRARVSCRLREEGIRRLQTSASNLQRPAGASRRAHFAETGSVEAELRLFDAMTPGERLYGPVIIESPVTTVVINPGASVERTEAGTLSVHPWDDEVSSAGVGPHERLRA